MIAGQGILSVCKDLPFWDIQRIVIMTWPAMIMIWECIAGGAVAAGIFAMFNSHPLDSSKPLLNLDIALVVMPCLLFGVSLGKADALHRNKRKCYTGRGAACSSLAFPVSDWYVQEAVPAVSRKQ